MIQQQMDAEDIELPGELKSQLEQQARESWRIRNGLSEEDSRQLSRFAQNEDTRMQTRIANAEASWTEAQERYRVPETVAFMDDAAGGMDEARKVADELGYDFSGGLSWFDGIPVLQFASKTIGETLNGASENLKEELNVSPEDQTAFDRIFVRAVASQGQARGAEKRDSLVGRTENLKQGDIERSFRSLWDDYLVAKENRTILRERETAYNAAVQEARLEADQNVEEEFQKYRTQGARRRLTGE